MTEVEQYKFLLIFTLAIAFVCIVVIGFALVHMMNLQMRTLTGLRAALAENESLKEALQTTIDHCPMCGIDLERYS